MIPRESNETQEVGIPVMMFVVTAADGSVSERRLELRPELEDVPLEEALGLVPGDRVKPKRMED